MKNKKLDPSLKALDDFINSPRKELLIHLSKALDNRTGYYCDPNYIDTLLELYGREKMNKEERYFMEKMWFAIKITQR